MDDVKVVEVETKPKMPKCYRCAYHKRLERYCLKCNPKPYGRKKKGEEKGSDHNNPAAQSGTGKIHIGGESPARSSASRADGLSSLALWLVDFAPLSW